MALPIITQLMKLILWPFSKENEIFFFHPIAPENKYLGIFWGIFLFYHDVYVVCTH